MSRPDETAVFDSLDLVIDTVVAREVLDSRGTPTVEADHVALGGRGKGSPERPADHRVVEFRAARPSNGGSDLLLIGLHDERLGIVAQAEWYR